MKKILIIILIIFIGCSQSNKLEISNDSEPLSKFDFHLNKNYGKEGEIINLYGTNIKINDLYFIKIGEIDCPILEINNDSIKFQIPEECESGNLTISTNDESIEVNHFKILFRKYYAIKKVWSSNKKNFKIDEFDINTGSVIKTIEFPEKNKDESFRASTYSFSKKEIIVLSTVNKTYPIKEGYVYIFNINESKFSKIQIDENINYGILSDYNDNIYVCDRKKIYLINRENGNSEFYAEVQAEDIIEFWHYDPINNNIIIITREGDIGNLPQNYKFYKLNLSTNELNYFYTSDRYYESFYTAEGRFFAISIDSNTITEFDINNFEELPFKINIEHIGARLSILEYIEDTNEFIGIYNKPCSSNIFCFPYFFKMDVEGNITNGLEWKYESYETSIIRTNYK